MENAQNLQITPITIADEMKRSYLDYAMSVIVQRALPDVRDGLKPVHRRVLFAMRELGNEWNKPYKKSARVVGDVIGKYHPHGDSAVYNTMVRMAQDFSMRVPLIDGQGNFGSMDGDNAAAMRYTEARMAKATTALMTDLEKDTVDFRPNYDESLEEPTVLPARFPNLLVNGTAGIAVGMATNIPPHNLGEVIDATVHLVDNPEASVADLMQFVKGPDFPTGALMTGMRGMVSAYESGRGTVMMRARTEVEKLRENREAIIITEVPYQVNKAALVEKIADLYREKLVEGISDLRDESSRGEVRVVIELKRDAMADVVLNQLYRHTDLQTSFSFNMLAIDGGRPKLMGLKGILQAFLKHREEVITRRTKFELAKTRARAHILAGLATAVANIDEVIKLIRNAPDGAEAKVQLMAKAWAAASVKPLIELLGEEMDGDNYRLTDAQAQAILDLKLQRLTGLERDKIQDEAEQIKESIRYLISILASREVMLSILKDELKQVKEEFSTPRRTEVTLFGADLNMEDLIKPEEMVVTISTDGWVKRQPLSDYRAQRRGGKGKSVTNMKDDEELETLFVANTHRPLLFFTSTGQVHTRKVYELPLASAGARGKALVNFLSLEKDETVTRVLPVPSDKTTWSSLVALFATAKGIIRKTPLTAFNNVNSSGIKGISIDEGDSLVNVAITGENEGDVLLSSYEGKAVRFSVESLRTIASRAAYGVRGMELREGDYLVSMSVINAATPYVLTVTENGYGKRTAADDFPAKSRGTLGVIAIQTTERNGNVVASLPVGEGDEVILVTNDGQVIRTRSADISVIGRNTQGVTLFKVEGKTKVTSACVIPAAVLQQDGNAEEGEVPVEEGSNVVPFPAAVDADGAETEAEIADQETSDEEE